MLFTNSGSESVETALKVARKWGYLVKGVPEGEATIVAMEGNFHGRTTTIVGFSDDPDARDDRALVRALPAHSADERLRADGSV